MNGTLAVARYTLLEMSRRRLLLVFFIVGAGGIALLGIGVRAFSSLLVPAIEIHRSDGSTVSAADANRLIELTFVSNLISVLGLFALLMAFAIGMTAIYHDLESGSAVAIFSKPVSRFAFAAGKLAAAIVAMIAIVGVLGVEARLVMLLFGGGLEEALSLEILAAVANAVTLMLVVLALSSWMNNIVAAIVAFVFNGVTSVVNALHQQVNATNQGGLEGLKAVVNVAYWLVPHQLVSSAPREIVRSEFLIINTGPDMPPVDDVVSGIPGPSGAGDILWWLLVVVVLCGLLYLAVRRRQV